MDIAKRSKVMLATLLPAQQSAFEKQLKSKSALLLQSEMVGASASNSAGWWFKSLPGRIEDFLKMIPLLSCLALSTKRLKRRTNVKFTCCVLAKSMPLGIPTPLRDRQVIGPSCLAIVVVYSDETLASRA